MSRKYALLGKIAAGGMGTVHVAQKRGQRAPLYALKIAHAHLAEDASVRRAMTREARAAASVVHPNVVRVFDVVEEGASLDLVMEYVEGASLGELVAAASARGERIAPDVVARIVVDVAEGLEAVHARGLVHRDVSPQNILVGLDKLADFGLVKSASGHEASTTEGTVKGKLGYVAPEYVRGRAIDARVDTFALGVVAWEALAGRRLFRGASDAETLENVLRAPAPPLGRVDAELAPFDPILDAMVAKDPDARPATIGDARAGLLRACEGRLAPRERVAALVTAAAGEALSRRRAEIERRRRALGLRRAAPVAVGALAVIALCAASAVSLASHARVKSAPPPIASATVAPSSAPPAASSAPASATPENAAIELDRPATTASHARHHVLPRRSAEPPPTTTVARPPPNPY